MCSRKSIAVLVLTVSALAINQVHPQSSEAEQAGAVTDVRRIQPMPQANQGSRVKVRPNVVRPRTPSNLVGDADGNGLFDTEDARFVRQSTVGFLRRSATPAMVQARGKRIPLADVAVPCGRLDQADLGLLVAALRARTAGYLLDSDCHRQAIGTPLAEREPEFTSPAVTVDDLFVRVGEQVPEFGGLYLEDGALRIVLTDTRPEVMERAARAVVAVFGGDVPQAEQVEPVKGKYGFVELKGWKDRARGLLSSDEVSSVDADEVRNRVTIGIENLGHRDAVEQLLVSFGIPLDAVNFKERGVFQTLNHELIPHIQSQVRPLRGGLDIAGFGPGGEGSGCTLGFLARSIWGIGFVTNEHCTPAAGAPGSTFHQPATGPAVGAETRDAPCFTATQNSACPDGCTCRWSDAAFVTIDPGVTGRVGMIAKSSHFWPYNLSTVVQQEGAPPMCGKLVYKVGAVSGQVDGEVVETCCDVDANWSTVGNSPSVVTQLCQTLVEASSLDGDSGAPVFAAATTSYGLLSVQLFGLAWGSFDDEYAFSPIPNIEAEIGSLWPEDFNQAPDITILEPAQGATLGGGAFSTIDARASFFDFEDGACDTGGCSVRWIDTLDGLVGESPVTNGEAALSYMLSGSGTRILIAAAEDSRGAIGVDWVKYSTGNGPPQVWIEWPSNGTQLTAGYTYVVQGNSFDGDLFHALSCSSLGWDFQAPSSPDAAQGCTAQVVFPTVGQRTLTLTGVDPGGLSATATATVNVVAAPTTGPPVVTFLAPQNHVLLAPDEEIQLVGKAKDPDGMSPISYQWVVTGGVLVNSGSEATIGATSSPNDTATSIQWRPSTHVVPHCGGSAVQLELRATDADGQVGVGRLDVTVHSPPC